MNTISHNRVLRNILAGLLALALTLPIVGMAGTIQSFSAVSHGQEVYLQWVTTQETAITSFGIQRSFDGKYYHTLHTVTPTGSNSNYSYIDSDLFKGGLQTFYYRIEINSNDDKVGYSSIERVELAFSGIRKTWGSIKAMFR